MKREILILGLIVHLVVLTGCKKFLMVDPKASLSENELFSSEVGFQQALTGIYSTMQGRALYGDKLTMGSVSAMAQNYNSSNQQFIFKETVNLNVSSQEVKSFASGAWSSAYSAIGGLNNILDKIDARKSIFIGKNYQLVKGEALGLRAFLHFDLVRLFGGNVLSEPDRNCIPYRKVNSSLPSPPIKLRDAFTFILEDLKAAEGLLKEADLIISGDKNRRFRLNYYAIKAMEARLYLCLGDRENAIAAAKVVVDSGKFKFIESTSLSSSDATKDRLFSTELVFSLRVDKVKDWVETGTSYFKKISDPRSNLTRTVSEFQTLFETSNGGTTDYRFAYLIENHDGTTFSSKYWQTNSGDLNKTVPLIRLSEMYYILAESAVDLKEAVGYLNQVRIHRGLRVLLDSEIDAVKLKDEITKEYQKEFYAEGQLFFYYKRRQFDKMLFRTDPVQAEAYVLLIPEGELEYNPLFNKKD